jgi:hypothetical protein
MIGSGTKLITTVRVVFKELLLFRFSFWVQSLKLGAQSFCAAETIFQFFERTLEKLRVIYIYYKVTIESRSGDSSAADLWSGRECPRVGGLRLAGLSPEPWTAKDGCLSYDWYQVVG